MSFSAIRDKVATESVRLAPIGASEAIGWGARATLPKWARAPLYRAFARVVGARLDEVELPLDEYRSLGSFFTRRLRAGARHIADGRGIVISPCDGRIAAAGRSTDGRLIQAKGRDYTLAELLAGDAPAERFAGGAYLTIYLSPRDYHRVHAPCDGEVLGYDYVPGTLLPVNPKWAASIPDLFARNERVVIHLATSLGDISLVMVGATGVGNMALSFAGIDARSFRHRTPREVHRVRFDGRRPRFERGDELGCFQLGSTVVLAFEPGAVELEPLDVGVAVQFGQAVAHASRKRREGVVA